MAGMSRKEIARLLDHIEPQGVTATRTTKGVMLRLPDGSKAMLHWTGSDVREAKNVRARLRRAGVSWPTDGEGLSDRILKSRPQKRTLESARAALEGWDQRAITGAQLRRRAAALGHTTMTVHSSQVALWHLGWTPTGPTTQRKWLRPIELEPEPTHLMTAAELEAQQQPAEALDTAQVVQLPEADQRPADGGTAPVLREFIDTADSWTADPAKLPADLTLAQLAQVLGAFGLDGEIRVWRHHAG